MERLLLENVRCFGGRHDIRLAPITVLIGENSTGKTTFLASIRAAWDIAYGQGTPNFKEEPFDLGSFEQIANFPSHRSGRARTFRIGAEHKIGALGITAEGSFSDEDSQPTLHHWTALWGDSQLTLDIPNREEGHFTLRTAGGTSTEWALPTHLEFEPQASSLLLWIAFRIDPLYTGKQIPSGISEGAMEELSRFLINHASAPPPRPTAFAPIRSQPERTYDPGIAPPDSFGAHFPLALRQVLRSDDDHDRWVREALVSFGASSGLFKGLRIRGLRNPGDPFQVQIHNTGPDRNLIDVGYGVSQILPVMFDAIQGQYGQTFLFQQPEVHLHPKAQAEFATSIARLVAVRGLQAIIETHSDYILDRLRIEARMGQKITAEDVAILYFERKGTSVKIHEIGLDEQANLTNVPRGFRDFFLREQQQLLGL